MKIKKRLKIILALGFMIALAFFVSPEIFKNLISRVEAANFTGWIWGGGAESDSSVPWDGTNTNVRWISMSSSDRLGYTGPAYGVTVDSVTGKVTGYGWSGGDDAGSGLGWIDFNPQDHCVTAPATPGLGQYRASSTGCTVPSGSGCVAGVTYSFATKTFSGCARVVGIAQETINGNNGGWDGWIRMNPTGNTAYDVRVINDSGDLRGYAWNEEKSGTPGEGLGWFDFSRSSISGGPALALCPNPVTVTKDGIAGQLQARYWGDFFGSVNCSTGGYDGSITADATWTSSNENVAVVSKLATNKTDHMYVDINGVDVGSATITATYNSLSSSTTVNVLEEPCVPNCNDKDQYCAGKTYTDNCGNANACTGTKDCSWREVSP